MKTILIDYNCNVQRLIQISLVSIIILLSIILKSPAKEYRQRIAAPKDLKAVILNDYSVLLNWNLSDFEPRPLELMRREGKDPYFRMLCEINPLKTFSYIDSTIKTGVKYEYRLKVKYTRDYEEYSSLVSVKTEILPPNEVKIIPLSDSEIELSWINPNHFPVDYLVEKKVEGVFRPFARLKSNITSIQDSGLTTEKIHYYRISAVSPYNCSPSSAADSIILAFNPPKLSALKILSDHKIILQFKDDNKFDHNALIEKKVNELWITIDTLSYCDEKWDKYGLSVDNSIEYIDTSALFTEDNLYRIRCGTQVNRTAASNLMMMRYHPPSPFDFKCDLVHDTVVNITWQDSSRLIDHYLLFRRTETTDYELISQLDNSCRDFTDSTVEYFNKYTYRLQGMTPRGYSADYIECSDTIIHPLEGMKFIPQDEWSYDIYSLLDDKTFKIPTSSLIDSFYIDRDEVTNGIYSEFCRQTWHQPPPDPGFKGYCGYFENYPDYPVVMVSWYDAIAFCNWRNQAYGMEPVYDEYGSIIREGVGYYLPSEAQFQLAIQTDSLTLSSIISDNIAEPPNLWGWDDGCSYILPKTTVKAYDTEFDTGCYEENIHNLIGNVWEWCYDDYEPITEEFYPAGLPSRYSQYSSYGQAKLVMGGAFSTAHELRRQILRYGYAPANKSPTVGFRCVMRLHSFPRWSIGTEKE